MRTLAIARIFGRCFSYKEKGCVLHDNYVLQVRLLYMSKTFYFTVFCYEYSVWQFAVQIRAVYSAYDQIKFGAAAT